MKIRLTEAQFAKIKLLKENYEPINKFEAIVNKITETVNGYYSRVLHTTIAELISNEFDSRAAGQTVDDLERLLMREHTKATEFINQLPEETYDQIGTELDNKIHDLYHKTTNKIDGVRMVINHMEAITEYQDEHKLASLFTDIKPLDISGNQES